MRQGAAGTKQGGGAVALALGGMRGSKWDAVAAGPGSHSTLAAAGRLACLLGGLVVLVAPANPAVLLEHRELLYSAGLPLALTSVFVIGATRILGSRGGRVGCLMGLALAAGLTPFAPDAVPTLWQVLDRDGRISSVALGTLERVGPLSSPLPTLRLGQDQRMLSQARMAVAFYYAQHDGRFPQDQATLERAVGSLPLQCRGQGFHYAPETGELRLAVAHRAAC